MHFPGFRSIATQTPVYLRSSSAAWQSRRGRRPHDHWSWPPRVQQHLSCVIIPLKPLSRTRKAVDSICIDRSLRTHTV
jgi:hypothetical protein